MFEATPFAVAMSPVVRVADPPGPRNDSAAKLAMVGVLTPGPVAMDLLTQVQIHRLDDVERTEYLVAWERAARWVEAQRMKAVVAVAGATATNRDDFAREHVKVALSGCGGSARADVDLARDMTGRLAAAGAALARGEISYSHARVLSTETFVLDDATAGTVAAAVLRRDEHRTPSQFRAAVRRAVIQADPVRAELAAERAAKERMVAKQALADGQAALTLTGPAVGVATIWTAADAYAAHPGADDDRTLDQRRFDAVVTICAAALGRPDAPAGRAGVRPTVYLYADLPTWAGLAEHPVELDGYGVIPAGAAREHFTATRWRAVVTDAAGAVTAVPKASYTHSADLNRQLHVADRRCGFPSCGAAVWFCDADHNRPYDSGGCTDADNCGLLCRRHHRLKTFTTWSWRRGANGAIEWIDPNGVRWDREPIRYVMPDVPESDVSDAEVPVAKAPEPPKPEACSGDPPF